jgi:glycosyltransferase involved in cell wall biosynthesis
VPESHVPLRGAIDVSPLALTRAGTARYVVNLLAELGDLDDVELRPVEFPGSSRLAKVARDVIWYPALLPASAARSHVDFLHCTTIRAPFVSRVPVVVTVHDVAPLRRPEAFNGWMRRYTSATLPRIVRRAAAVITVSEFQRRELAAITDVAPERVRVVPQGVGPPFTEAGERAAGDYVLAVGTLEPRKNLPRVVDGFRRAALGCELRIAGEQGWGGVALEGDDVRWLGRVSDEDLAALYRGARCVVYGSQYEGFGLPVLEAMAAGASVVCAAGPPYDEFADGIAVTCDPADTESIAGAIRDACNRRDDLGALGRSRAADFTWERTARATLAVYREVAR